MTIKEKIKLLIPDLPIPIYYLKRPDEERNCIVYTYTETPALVGDMKELGTKYTILFNLYCADNVEDTKELIKIALKQHGFKKKIILGTILENNALYNTAMQYYIGLKSN
ncbi:hypothetical protein [Clostridium butyricum]|uniref:hypothetical protein n=1 Tax=Clostridium butyricum TaxID=1492 RepID=UPI002AB23D98|nr:hypothetical protein [Clostridium butyricum]